MEIILPFHVVLMSASIVMTAGSLVAAVCGVKVATMFQHTNLGVTTAGILSGLILIATAPLGMSCVILTAYVAAFWLASRYVANRTTQLTAVES